MHPLPAGRGLRTGTPRLGYPSHRMRGRTLSLVKPRRSFKWNKMANCGDTYVFFDPLGSSESVLSSNSQTLAPHNGCQEVVSKRGLDRFVRRPRSSITLTFSILEANNKNPQLSRGSKCKPAQMFKNEGPMNPDFGEITQQLCTLINDNLRASRVQSQTQFELCRGAAVNADISPNLSMLDHSLREV